MSEETIKPIAAEQTKVGLQILQSALLIGILGDILLRKMPWGLNIFLWVTAVGGAMLAITLVRRRELWTQQTQILYLALLFFSSTFLYRASPGLLFFNGVAIFTIWAVLTLPILKLNIKFAGVSHYLLGFVWSGLNLLVSPFLVIFSDVKWKTSSESGWTKTLLPIVRGLLIVAPLLVIFGGLFMAADAAFEGMILRVLNIDPSEIFRHLLLTAFLSWIVAGYLRAAFIGSLVPEQLSTKPTENPTETPVDSKPKFDWRNFQSTSLPNALTLGTIEVSIIWGAVNLLFLSFVLVQLPYLFGGFDYVQTSENLKLADYARRGFGELVFVSVLVLPLLLLGHWFLRRDHKITERVFQTLAGIQIVLLFVIMISAAQRMLLYTGNQGYGLTLERFYPMVLMAALAAVFIWFAATMITGFRDRFAWGALWIFLCTLGMLNVMNPEEFVLKTNVRLKQEGRNFDTSYNFHSLNEDAIPTLIELMPNFNDKEKCYVENSLSSKLRELDEESGLKNWNYSRWRTQGLLERYIKDHDWNPNAYRDCYKEFQPPGEAVTR